MARVPLFKERSQTTTDTRIKSLDQEKVKLEKHLSNESITEINKAIKVSRITEINSEIQQIITINQKQKEDKIINEIKSNPKALYNMLIATENHR